MPRYQTRYDGKSMLRLKIDIHGIEKTLEALVDTGFVSGTGAGIKLPLSYLQYARTHGTGRVTTAEDREVAVAMIPNAKITEIEDEHLESEITIPALFWEELVRWVFCFSKDAYVPLTGLANSLQSISNHHSTHVS